MPQAKLIQMPARIAVLGVENEHLFWCDEDRARELLRSGQARLIRRGGQGRVLRATGKLLHRMPLRGRGTAFDRTQYSHNHETRDNPERCWTLKRIPSWTRQEFTRVLADCLKAA